MDTYFPVVPLGNRKEDVRMMGIHNPQYLCFMIAVVQCMASNQHLAYYLLRKYKHTKTDITRTSVARRPTTPSCTDCSATCVTPTTTRP